MSTALYRLLSDTGAEEQLELHVLARAYLAAWFALHARAPTGLHPLDRLGVTIDFGTAERSSPRQTA